MSLIAKLPKLTPLNINIFKMSAITKLENRSAILTVPHLFSLLLIIEGISKVSVEYPFLNVENVIAAGKNVLRRGQHVEHGLLSFSLGRVVSAEPQGLSPRKAIKILFNVIAQNFFPNSPSIQSVVQFANVFLFRVLEPFSAVYIRFLTPFLYFIL